MKFVPINTSLSLYCSDLLPNDVNFAYLGGQGEIYYEEGVHHFLEKPDSYLSFVFNDEGIDMRELKIKEINDTNFVFYCSQNLNYYENKNDGDGNEKENDDTILIIVYVAVGVGALAIIIILIVVIVNHIKNKNLNKDIYKISFEKERESNLLLNEEN